MPSFVAPELSCTSSMPIRSGERRLSTICAASRGSAAVSLGSRFSTLKVAIAISWSREAAVTSGASVPGSNVGVVRACTLKFEKL